MTRPRRGARTVLAAAVGALLLGVDLGAVVARAEAVPIVANVLGQSITTADLATYWFARYPEEYARTLDDLIVARLARDAASRFGLGVPRDALDRAEQREVEARRAQVRTLLGADATLEDRIETAYGLDLTTWRRDVLRPRLYDVLLVERVVRHETRRRERLTVRVLVAPDEARARELAADLKRGADFGLLATTHSIDPTARRGGALPAFGRGDLAWPDVEERLFRALPGELVGPLRVRVEPADAWHLYKVVGREPAWPDEPASRGARLEKDLLDHPVEAAEIERWRARAAREGRVERFRPDGRPWR